MADTAKQIDREAFESARDAAWKARRSLLSENGFEVPRPPKFDEWFEAGWLAARATPVSPAQGDPVFVNQLQEAIFAARSIDGREDYWNDVLARLGVTAPAKPHSDLHSAIMNLPCNAGRAIAMNDASMQAYKEGHRDARHAAAELVAAHFATTPSEGVAAPVEHEAKTTSKLTLAVIGRRHFGNPIPQEWYAAAHDLLADVAQAAPAQPSAEQGEPKRKILPELGSTKPEMLLYTDAINGEQVGRDDLWIVTTEVVNRAAKFGSAVAQAPVVQPRQLTDEEEAIVAAMDQVVPAHARMFRHFLGASTIAERAADTVAPDVQQAIDDLCAVASYLDKVDAPQEVRDHLKAVGTLAKVAAAPVAAPTQVAPVLTDAAQVDDVFGYWIDGEWYGYTPNEHAIDYEHGAKVELTPVWTHNQAVTFRCEVTGEDHALVPDTEADAALLTLATTQAERQPQPAARYTCVGKGGEYELLGVALGAGKAKLIEPLTIYRDTTSSQMFFRSHEDFNDRMTATQQQGERSDG